MKRRTLLGGGVAAATVVATPAISQSGISLSLLTDRGDAASSLANRISAVSGGRISVNVTTATASDAPGFLDQVSSGGSDMYLTSTDAFVSRNPAFGLFAAMPGGMSPSELESWITIGDGRFMLDLLGEEFGIKAFMAGDDGAMPMWARSPVTGLSDIQSGGVASTGLGLQVLSDMGVQNVVDVFSGGDLSSVSSIEGLSVSQMAQSGLLGAFPHMVTPNAGRPSAMVGAGVNLSKWSSLSDADRLLIERCIMAEHGVQRGLALHNNVVALSDAGAAITAQEMPQDVWDAQIGSANNVLSQMFDAGDIAADSADAYLFFIGDVAGWSEIGETAYFLGRKQALTL